MFLPYITGEWSSDNMTWEIGANGGLALALVWLYFMCWSSYGIEVVATFAPEYHDTERDTARALRAAALFSGGRLRAAPARRGRHARHDGDRRGRRRSSRSTTRRSTRSSGSGLANVMIFCVVGGPGPVDEHRDDGRLESAVRHLEGRDDDQGVRGAEQAPRARPRDDARRDPEHLPDQRLRRRARDPRGQQRGLRVRHLHGAVARSSCCAATGPTGRGRSGCRTTGCRSPACCS